jgi:hypothetical protein
MKVICINNRANISLDKRIGIDKELGVITFDWLKVGTIYNVDNIIGQCFMDLDTETVIDGIILKEFKGWLPINLFMEVSKWREQQINKIL